MMTADFRVRRFEPDIREWAVRVAALEMKDSDPAAALASVALRVGCTPATLRRWMRQAERAGGIRPGVFTNPRRRVAELEDEVRPRRTGGYHRRPRSSGHRDVVALEFPPRT